MSCPATGNTSFPLKTTISNINLYYDQIQEHSPDISASYVARNTRPSFSDPSRMTSTIDEPTSSMTVKYNGAIYNLLNIQICLASHIDWLPKKSGSQQNKVDIIITLENTQSIDIRFVIIVIPLVIDKTLLLDNIYLQGLCNLTNLSFYTLESLFVSLHDFFFYTTCLEPNPDNAFVYVNTDGLKVTPDLYATLLSLWLKKNKGDVVSQLANVVVPLKNTINNIVQQINQTSDLSQIQNQIANIQVATQSPTTNPSIDIWPNYSAPYNILLNVAPKIITSTTMEGFQNKENFQGYTSSGGLVGSIKENNERQQEYINNTIPASGELSLTNIKCVPLDLDAVVDNNNNINFNGDGSLTLSQIYSDRITLRNSTKSINSISTSNVLIWLLVPVSCIIAIWLLSMIVSYVFRGPKYDSVFSKLPSGINDIGLHSIILIIFTFAGFCIGAAVNTS